MTLHYLKIAGRQLLKNKFHLFINTAGMGIAIACAMTAYLLVAYNIEFDDTIERGRVKNIVKLVHYRKDTNGDPFREMVAPIFLAPAAMNDIAGITGFSRYCSDGGYVHYNEKGFHETIFFADSSFFRMFNLALVKGAYESFNDRNTIFISEKFTRRYFGDADPIGKELVVSINSVQRQVTVGGMLRDAPFNSTFTPDLLMRVEQYLDIYRLTDDDWASAHQASVLFELADVAQAPAVAAQLGKYTALRNAAKPEAHSTRYDLLPFFEPVSPNDVRQSYLHLRIPVIALVIFMMLGAIILLIACFNLTNTTLALFMKRLKEIGVRKVAGSSRYQVALQLFCEITLTVSLSVVAGFVMALYMIPQFAAMWELPYGLNELNRMNMFIALMTLLIASAVLAGAYPALFGSRQSPLLLFRGAKGPGGTNVFTRSLLVIQFTLSIMVLIAGTVFTQNAVYQDNISFGYDKEMIITALIQGPQEAEALSHAIASYPRIESVSAAVHHFALINAPERPAQIADAKFNATVYDVGPTYFTTVGLKMISGKPFNANDTASRGTIIVDENFVKHNHLADPLATTVDINGVPLSIIGIVSNHLTDLESHNTEDYVYRLAKPAEYQVLVVRAEASSLAETQHHIHEQWKKLFPGKPLRTDLQEDIVYHEADAYNRNLSRIFFFMTVLGCVLSISGLYSMASLNLHRRTREIGVRKALGASVVSILKLVNREFAVILLIAAMLGGYGGYRLADALLSDLFAQHTGIGLLTVVLNSSLVFLVGITATSVTAWATANANPVIALKSV